MYPFRVFCRRKVLQILVSAVVLVFYIQFQLLSYTERRLLIKKLTLTLPSQRGSSSEQQPGKICSQSTTLVIRESSNGLTLMTWASEHIKDLSSFIDYPLFPKHPAMVLFNTKASLRLPSADSTAGWLFGSLLAPETGEYRFAMSSSGDCQLRLSSDEGAENYRVLVRLSFSTAHEQPSPGQYNKHSSQSSVSVVLHKCRQYFIEAVFYNQNENGHVEIAWETPSSLQYEIIPAVFLSSYIDTEDFAYNEENLLVFEDNLKMNALFWRLVREKRAIEVDQLEGWRRLPFMNSQHTRGIVPSCSRDMKGHNPGGLLEIPKINSKATLKFVHDFTNRLLKANKGKYSYQGLHYCEEKAIGHDNRRLLLNLVFRDNIMDMRVRVSEYLFYENERNELCGINGFRWRRDAMVTIIAVIREMDIWSHYFMDHLSEMTTKLQDARFSVIIVAAKEMKDYFQAIVSQNTLAWHSHVTLLLLNIKQIANIREVLAMAASHIRAHNTIMFFTDIRVQMPTKILEHVRKRTLEGRTTFLPWPENFDKRFYQNATIVNPLDGTQTDHPSSFALYMSDWKQLNERTARNKRRNSGSANIATWWQALVDSDLEIYSTKIPKLFYFPSRKTRG